MAGTDTAGTDTSGTGTDLPTSLTRLTFHGPLSEARAGRLVDRLTRARPATVLDIGCGWGELMLRILAVLPDATGFGFDTDEGDLARARDTARARGLSDRVTFAHESGVGTTRGPADLVLCIGSSHALTEAEPPESIAAALAILRRLVTPGGRVLLSESFWQHPPTEAELAAMWPGTTAGDLPDLPGWSISRSARASARRGSRRPPARNGRTSSRATSATRRNGWRPTPATRKPPGSRRRSTSTVRSGCAATAASSGRPTSPWSRSPDHQLLTHRCSPAGRSRAAAPPPGGRDRYARPVPRRRAGAPGPAAVRRRRARCR